LIWLSLLGLVSVVTYAALNYQGLTAPDAFYYGSIARNIVSGEGLVTDSLRPHLLFDSPVPYFERLVSPPAHPVLLSFFFFLFGVNEHIIPLVSSLCFLTSIPLVYVISKESFSRPIAIIASIAYTLNLEMLYFSTSGLTEPLFIFFLLASVLTLLRANNWQGYGVAGCFLGLARLTRINAIVFLLPLLYWVWKKCQEHSNSSEEGARRWLRTLGVSAALFGFLLVSGPELYRDALLYGDPIFSVHSSAISAFHASMTTGYKFFGSISNVSLGEMLNSHAFSFLKSYVHSMVLYLSQLPLLTNWVVVSLAFLGLIVPAQNETAKKLQLFVAWSFIIQLLLLSSGSVRIRYFQIFIPLLLPIAFSLWQRLTSTATHQIFAPRRATTLILALAILSPFLLNLGRQLVGEKNGEPVDVEARITGRHLAERTDRSELLMTDRPYELAWFANRKTIYMATSAEETRRIEALIQPISTVVLFDVGPDMPAWKRESMNSLLIAGYVEKEKLALGMKLLQRSP